MYKNLRGTCVPALLLLCAPVSALADLIYYIPFDQGGSASLINAGSLGGTATTAAGPYGGKAPQAAAETAPNIGGVSSEKFTGSGTAAGAVVLPASTDQFLLNSSASKLTLSTWVYWNGPLASGQPSGIANNSIPGASGWSLTITSGGNLSFSYVSSGGSGSTRTSTAAIGAGQWVNVALTWNTGSTEALAFYINGVASAPTNTYTGASELNTNSEPIRLGTNSYFIYNSLNGQLDDYAMWNTVLSAAEIKALNTAPALLAGYDAGVMNGLFNVAKGVVASSTVNGLVWQAASGFSATGQQAGNTWQSGDLYYIWLSGDAANPLGLVASAIPEPATAALLLAAAGLVLTIGRRRLSKNRSSSNATHAGKPEHRA